MKRSKRINQFQRMHDLIKRKATGSPKTLARKLYVSNATIYRYLIEMKKLGAPIYYCRTQQTYYYGEEYELTFFE